jgi:hypothetical protein
MPMEQGAWQCPSYSPLAPSILCTCKCPDERRGGAIPALPPPPPACFSHRRPLCRPESGSRSRSIRSHCITTRLTFGLSTSFTLENAAPLTFGPDPGTRPSEPVRNGPRPAASPKLLPSIARRHRTFQAGVPCPWRRMTTMKTMTVPSSFGQRAAPARMALRTPTRATTPAMSDHATNEFFYYYSHSHR